MLNSTGDTDCEVDLRTNGLTGLSNLQILGLPAVIYNCTGAGYGTAQNFCQILQDLEVLCAAYSTSTGYQDLGIHDVNGIGYSLNDFLDGYVFVVRSKSGIVLFDHSLCTCDRSDLLHNAGTNGCHLRSVVGAGDGSDGVTTECRTGHQQLVVLLLLSGDSNEREITDLKYSTVSSQTGLNSCGNGRAEVTSDSSCTYQNDLRLIFLDNRCQCMCIRLGSVSLQFGIVHKDYLICAILSQLISQSFYVITDQNRGYLGLQLCSQLFTFAEQLQCDTADLIVYLLGEHIYTLVFFNIIGYHGLPPILDDVLFFEFSHNVSCSVFR